MAEKPEDQQPEQQAWPLFAVPESLYRKCHKCGKLGAEAITLAKNYHANLCISCANLWHVYVMESAEWEARCAIHAQYNHLAGLSWREGEPVPLKRWLDHETDKRIADLALFRMAEAWVQTPPDRLRDSVRLLRSDVAGRLAKANAPVGSATQRRKLGAQRVAEQWGAASAFASVIDLIDVLMRENGIEP